MHLSWNRVQGTFVRCGGFRPPAATPRRDCAGALQPAGRPAPRMRPPWTGQIALSVRQWYQPHLERLYDNPGARMGDLDQLEQIAGTYPTRSSFLTELTLDPPEATSAEAIPPHLDEDYLVLSTIHSAKGQEWDAVFVLNVIVRQMHPVPVERHGGHIAAATNRSRRSAGSSTGGDGPRSGASAHLSTADAEFLHAAIQHRHGDAHVLQYAHLRLHPRRCSRYADERRAHGRAAPGPRIGLRSRRYGSMSPRGCGRCGIRRSSSLLRCVLCPGPNCGY